MSADNFLSRLERVRKTGPGRWLARCPAHDDKGPSLSIRETEDGRTLLNCFAGCSAHEVITAAGLTLSDLFPERPQHHAKGERRPFPAVDVLRAIAFEALVVSAAAVSLLAGQPFTETDRARLILATERIQNALMAAGVSHGY
jgi:hypothetical protein